jgi:putative ABC transport system ATP-binding protein
MTAISVENLSKVYGQGASAVRALDDVNFQVEGGEVVLLMGPSGSGKTTLLSVMGCILRPSSGRIQIHGQDVTGLSERKIPGIRLKQIGFIFQGFNLFPTLSAGENVEISLDLHGVRGRKAKLRAAELLDQVGLADKYRAYPADLSGGQKQRVAIARALAGEPAIILADEPTAALDSSSGRMVMNMLKELAHERSRAVVIVTHDNRVLEYGDRIAHIEDGKLAQTGNEMLDGFMPQTSGQSVHHAV